MLSPNQSSVREKYCIIIYDSKNQCMANLIILAFIITNMPHCSIYSAIAIDSGNIDSYIRFPNVLKCFDQIFFPWSHRHLVSIKQTRINFLHWYQILTSFMDFHTEGKFSANKEISDLEVYHFQEKHL
jgi:hypothetical protein